METYAGILRAKHRVLAAHPEWAVKLKGYKLVDDVDRLRVGHYIRWISAGRLNNGGFLVEVGLTDKGIYLKTKHLNRFVTIYMHRCKVFQLISYDEAVMLASSDG
jgi:hypothetical protein